MSGLADASARGAHDFRGRSGGALMQALTLAMFVAVTIVDFLSQGDRFGEWHLLPGSASYLAELLSGLALMFVIALGVRNRFESVRALYWLLLGSVLAVVICGIIANAVGSGPIIAGARTYLRALPWFFVPMVYRYSERQLGVQLRVLLAICLLQVPIAIRQRINTADNSFGFVAKTGDWTTGTLSDAGILCVFLVCASCVLAAMYERKRLGFWPFLLLFLLVLLPTTINETKAMVVFLPLALLVTFYHAAPPQLRLRRLLVGFAVLGAFAAVFVPVYDALNRGREYSSSIGEFLGDKQSIEDYLSTGSGIGSVREAGRIDALLVPVKQLSSDVVTLMFGYGLGNASDSSIGPAFSGVHATTFRPFQQTAMTKFVLEIGLLGCGLLLAIYWLIFLDSRMVARSSTGLHGTVAAAWTGTVALITLGSFYAKIEIFPAVGFLFWYFSGLVAAERVRLASVRL